jgi:MSHA biogenesis protein MshJ
VKDLWRQYAAKIDALAERERIMVFVAALAVLVFLMHALFIDPAVTRRKALATRMGQQQTDMRELQTQIAALEKRRADPDAANLVRRDDIKRQIAEIDGTLKGMQQSLVPAQKMNALLQDMLARNPRLQIVTLRTLPATPLVERPAKTEKNDAGSPAAAAAGKSTAGDGNVFKHGVQITLRGSYTDLHDYLARLEKLPWHMFWSRASLNAEDYPRLTLTLTIYTLSLDKAWLVV